MTLKDAVGWLNEHDCEVHFRACGGARAVKVVVYEHGSAPPSLGLTPYPGRSSPGQTFVARGVEGDAQKCLVATVEDLAQALGEA